MAACSDRTFAFMDVLFVFLLVVFNCQTFCHGHIASENREKIIEDYVLSAKFDGQLNLPQLRTSHSNEKTDHDKGRQQYYGGTYEDGTKNLGDMHRYHVYENVEVEDPYNTDSKTLAAERDLMVHHHHVAAAPLPPAPPLPPPPPPAVIDYRPAFFAVGLIAFLTLLNALQLSLLYQMQNKPGNLLGTVTGALGRRRRSIQNELATKNSRNVHLGRAKKSYRSI